MDGANQITTGTIYKVRASDGVVLGTFSVGASPQAVVFDGTNIWVVCQRSGLVFKLRAANGSLVGAFSPEESPNSAAFDGSNVWVLTTNVLMKM